MSDPAWVSLLGTPFKWGGRENSGRDCLGIAIAYYDAIGLPGIIPDPRNGWRDVRQGQDRIGEGLIERGWRKVKRADLQPGHAIVLDWYGSGIPDHIGVFLGEGRMLHTVKGQGAHVIGLDAVDAHGAVWRGAWAPPKPIPGSSTQETPVALQAPLTVTQSKTAKVVMVEDPLGTPKNRFSWDVPPGTKVVDTIPLEWRKRHRRQVVALTQGGEVLEEDHALEEGEVVALVLAPAGIGFFTSFFIGIFLSAVNFIIQLALTPDLDQPEGPEDGYNSPTFRLDGIRNTASPGLPIPVVYGEHIVAGNIISIFFQVDEDDRQILNMLIAISQGPIVSVSGLTGEKDRISGASIPDTIKINGTAASEYQNVRISTRLGTEDQTPIPGFSQNISAVSYSITLGLNEPFTHTTSGNVDEIQAVIFFPSGLFNLSNSGNTNNSSVDITFRWRVLGTTAWTTQVVTYTEGKRAPFSKQFNTGPLANETYEFQVERTAGAWPPSNTRISNQTDLVAVNEVTDDALSYPGIALLGVQALSDEQLPGGTPPTVTSVVQGRSVYGYNPSNDFFPTSLTNDNYRVPAWVVMDLLLHPAYGLAVNGGITVDQIDLDSFVDWQDLTQTLVASGQGSSIRRAVCNMVVDTTRNGWEFLVALARSHYADIAVIGNKITAIPMKARDPVALFGMSQVTDFSLKYTGRKSRPNVVEVDYRNEQTDFEADIAQRVDDAIFGGEPIVKEQLSVLGVTHPGQAYRMVQFRLNHAELIGKVVSFKCGVDAIHLLPGDVIRVAHDAIAWGTSGRVRASTSNTVTLNREVTLSSGDKIVVRTHGTGADVLQVRDVSTTGTVAAGSPITLSSSWDAGDLPTQFDPFSVGGASSFVQNFQIDEIVTNPDLTREIRAKEYDAAVFNDDPGVVETFTDEIPDRRLIPDPIRFLHAVEEVVTTEDGGVIASLDVTIDKGPLTEAVDVWWRVSEASDPDIANAWRYAGRTYRDRIQFIGPGFGQEITISAVPVSPDGNTASAETGIKTEIVILGKTEAPSSAASLNGFCVEQIGDDLLLVTPEHPDRDVDEYVVFWSASSTSIMCATPVACVESGGRMKIPFRDYATGKYLLFAPRNRTGRYGLPYSEALNIGKGPGIEFDFLEDEHSSWGGTKVDCTVASGVLQMDPGVLTCEYESNGIAFSDGLEHRTLSLAKDYARLEQKDLDWDHAGFRWEDERFAAMDWDGSQQTGFENDAVYTWADAGFTWDSEILDVYRWDGPVDLVEATRPGVDIDYFVSSSWVGWAKSEPREVANVEQVASRLTLNAPTTGLWWRPEAFALSTVGLLRDASKYEVTDINGDYGDGSSALTIQSMAEQTGIVLRERYRRWPGVPTAPAHWAGTGVKGVTPAGLHNDFSISFRSGSTDTLFVDAPTPAWAEDDSASNFLNIRITWVGDQSTGGSAYAVNWLTGYRPWNESPTPVAFPAGLVAFDPQPTAIPAGYVAGQYITTTLTTRKSFFAGYASLDGNASPKQWVTTGIVRSSDTYSTTLAGNVYVLAIEVFSGYIIT